MCVTKMDYKKHTRQSYIGQSTTPHNWNVNVTEKNIPHYKKTDLITVKH